jgi:ATP-binding cassette, subfamily F, member 2
MKGSSDNLKAEEKKEDIAAVIRDTPLTSKELKHQNLLDDLAKNNIAVTYEAKRGIIHANTRDINVSGVTVAFHGRHLIEDTEIVINYGNRYGFIGPNGSGELSNLALSLLL